MRFSPGKLWSDLRRRRVFQVAAIYAAAAWVIVQVAGEFAPALFLPNWVMTALVVAVIVGFPISVVLAWLFDVGPEGVVRTRPGSPLGVSAIVISLGLLVSATAGFVYLIVPDDNPVDSSSVRAFDPMPNSIAVLPFIDLSAAGDQGHFGDGIADVLIHRLAQIQTLTVIARTSSFAFKTQATDIQDIGRKLRVEKILEGSIQKSDGQLRIAAQLIDARTGAHIWSRLYDHDDGDIFRIQDEISMQVAAELGLDTELSKQLSQDAFTDDLDAYEHYILGRNEFMHALDTNDVGRALEHFMLAIEIDPGFALAWSGLSDTYILDALNRGDGLEQALELSREASDNALALNPDLGEAYASKLLIAVMEYDLAAAESSYAKSSILSPSYELQYLWFGHMLARNSRLREASETYARGMMIQPYRPFHLLKGSYAMSLTWLGQYAKSMRLYGELIQQTAGTGWERRYQLARARFAQADWRFADAIAFAEIAERQGFHDVDFPLIRAHSYLALGDFEAADREARAAKALLDADQADSGVPGSYREMEIGNVQALIYLAVGETVESLRVTRALIREIEALAETEESLAVERAYLALAPAFNLRLYDETASLAELHIRGFPQSETLMIAGYSHKQLGNNDLAQSYFQQLNSALASQNEGRVEPSYFYIGEAKAAQGLRDEALDALRKAVEAGEDHPLTLVLSPAFDNLRASPEFQAILAQMRAATDVKLQSIQNADRSSDWESIVAQYLPAPEPGSTAQR